MRPARRKMSKQVRQRSPSGAESVLHLLHGLQSAPGGPRPRIWLVTSDAQAVADADQCSALWGAILWGLGRSLSAEHPDLWGGLIDLERRPATSAAQRLIQEVEAGTAEDKVAIRGERAICRATDTTTGSPEPERSIRHSCRRDLPHHRRAGRHRLGDGAMARRMRCAALAASGTDRFAPAPCVARPRSRECAGGTCARRPGPRGAGCFGRRGGL